MLEKLFNPGSVAVVGASRDRSKVGHSILANLTGGGYPGGIYPVNPGAASILGHRCHPGVSSIPGPVDLAVIAVPARFVPSVMEECGRKGVGAAVIISAGFRETGEEGRSLESRVLEIAARHGIRVLGPNCLGVINTANGLNASFAHATPKKGSIAFFSQSGALCTAILDWSLESGVGFSKFVSLGNKADVSELEMLSYLASDTDTRVILGYIEGVEKGRAFMETARAAVRKTPVILAKSGGTRAGARAASSHTGTLAGSEQAFEAAFKQTGVLRAGTIEELFNSALAFAGCPIPRSSGLAIVTNAGGPGIIAADACERSRVAMAELRPSTVQGLRRCLPASSGFFNPVDVLGDAGADRYACALEGVLGDPGVGGVLAVLTPQAMTDVEGTAACIARYASSSTKPVLASFMGGVSIRKGAGLLEKAGVPVYGYPEEGVKAFESLMRYRDVLARSKPRYARFEVDKSSASAAIAAARAAGRKELGENEAREVISAYGFRVPRNILAVTSGDAVKSAVDIGFPVALKISSPNILHKTDVGGVRLGLSSRDDVLEAFLEITSNASRLVPDALIRGCMVQEMAGPGREVILGMSRDPQFGPMIMLGMGGIYVEALKDVSFRIAPVGLDDADEMLDEVKGLAILRGLRGERPSDVASVSEAVLRLSQLVEDFPDIVELDINPYMVLGEGEGAIATDARLTLERGGYLMKALYIGSTMAYSGKSLVSLGLGLRMQKDGLSVGFMKPYGRAPVVVKGKLADGDASFMKDTLVLPDPVDRICPVVYSHDLFATVMKGGPSEMRRKVMAAYKSLARGRDVMLVGGARGIHDGAFMGVSGADLVAGMDASVIMVDPFDGEVSIDGVLAAKEIFGARLLGMVINKTPPGDMDYLKGLVGPYLKRKKIALLGILPADRLLNSITIGQIAETLGGRVLCREDMLGELVENFLIGAMEVESALKYFRRTPNKAVITGGHRSDILLAALETSTKCLVLTGNMPPNDLIITRAIAAGVPVVLVKHDTMTAMTRLEGAFGKVRIREEAKLARASELMDSHFDFKTLYRAAGISPR